LIVDLEDLLHRDPATGRDVLRTLLATPITVTPKETTDGVVWEYNAQARLDGLLAGCLAGGRSVNESNTTKNGGPGKARTVGPTFSGCWSLLDSAELFSAVPAHAASTTPPRSQRHRHRRAEELMWYSNSNFPQRQRPPQHVTPPWVAASRALRPVK
jgi:hypothetical protein